MDWYSYYKERFTWGANPNTAVAGCQRIVMEMLNSHIIPFRIAADSAIGYLAALYDAAGDCFSVSFPFRIAMNALSSSMQRVYEAAEEKDKEWARELMEAERMDGDGPPYEPDDYEVRDEDLDGEDTDGWDDDPALAIAELYGSGGESGTTGTRRHWPDWENIGNWTESDWVMMQTYKDKILAAAEAGFMGVSSVAGVLAAAKEAMNMIPLTRQAELGLWAVEVVDGLIFSMEDDLQKMCVGSLHSHEGRLVQKAMHHVTPEDGEK